LASTCGISISYTQFETFKESDKTASKDVSGAMNKLALEVNTLSTLISNFDDRYPLRKELDARYFKTAYRNND
jgi:hypothetical protein